MKARFAELRSGMEFRASQISRERKLQWKELKHFGKVRYRFARSRITTGTNCFVTRNAASKTKGHTCTKSLSREFASCHRKSRGVIKYARKYPTLKSAI